MSVEKCWGSIQFTHHVPIFIEFSQQKVGEREVEVGLGNLQTIDAAKVPFSLVFCGIQLLCVCCMLKYHHTCLLGRIYKVELVDQVLFIESLVLNRF